MPPYINLRLDFKKRPSIGPFRAALLQGIDELGSISATARALGWSFRSAWENLNQLNKESPQPVTSVKKNGPRGGATLTPFGKQLLSLYRSIENAANRELDKYAEDFDRLIENAPPPIPRGVILRIDKASPERKVARRVSANRNRQNKK